MSEVEIYHAKFRHSGMKNKEVMTVLVILGAVGRGVNRVKRGNQNGGGVIRVNYA